MARFPKPVMAERPLQAHPDLQPYSVMTLHGAAWQTGTGQISIAFHLVADMTDIVVPPPAPSLIREGLWTQTCFELFIGLPDGRGLPNGRAYYEINLSPSGEWCVYRFGRYRASPARVDGAVLDRFDLQADMSGLSLQTTIILPETEPLPETGCRVGLCAVIEHELGTLSHWALSHPADRPDFHDRRGFTAPFHQAFRSPKHKAYP